MSSAHELFHLGPVSAKAAIFSRSPPQDGFAVANVWHSPHRFDTHTGKARFMQPFCAKAKSEWRFLGDLVPRVLPQIRHGESVLWRTHSEVRLWPNTILKRLSKRALRRAGSGERVAPN